MAKKKKLKKGDMVICTPELLGRMIFRVLTGLEPTPEKLDEMVDQIEHVIENPL